MTRKKVMDHSEYELMKAKLQDLPMVRAFYWNLLDSSPKYAEILQWKKGIYPADEDWSDYIASGELYLLREKDRLLGCAAMTEKQGDAYRELAWESGAADAEAVVIHILAVDPGAQGRGVATAFLKLLEEKAKELGKRVIRLDAVETNAPAQKLYEKYGFRRQGTAEMYYESTGRTAFVFYEYEIGQDVSSETDDER